MIITITGGLFGQSQRLRDRLCHYLHNTPGTREIIWNEFVEPSKRSLQVVFSDEVTKWRATKIVDDIEELMIEERLFQVQNYVLEFLAWKFSSPALTNAFRGYILLTSPSDQTTSLDDDIEPKNENYGDLRRKPVMETSEGKDSRGGR